MNGVSIIIPTKGVPVFLDECVNSILKNNIDFPFEILIGIDSCHETVYHIEKDKIFYKKTKIFYFDSHVGPYVIKNSLVGIANYEYILFFDSDDIMTENMLNNFYLRIKEFDIVRFNCRGFTDDITKLHKPIDLGIGVFGIKKTIFNSLVGFQEWICAADTEFYERSNRKNLKVSIVDDISFFRRLHGNNLTLKKETKHGSEIRKEYVKIIEEKILNNVWDNPIKSIFSFSVVN